MNVVNANEFGINIIGRQQTSSEIDYVSDGTLHRGVNAPAVLVTSVADLSQLTDVYSPGAIAFTAGFQQFWQLGADGEWHEIDT